MTFYIGLWMSDEAAGHMLGFIAGEPQDDRRWIVIGRIEGEIPTVGLWVVIEEMTSVPDEQKIDFTGDGGAALIRWEWIRGAVRWREKPEDPIGFLQRRTPK